MTTELLSVQGISVSYGAVVALDGVSIRVDEGEAVSVIGSNGAGKTTLMKTVAGLLRARRGTITFGGGDITGIEAQDLVGRGISLVPEGRQVFGRMSVEENLILGAYSRRGSALEDDFAHCFALFPRLEERRNQRAGTLSGGEQQMLAIARGLMSRPKAPAHGRAFPRPRSAAREPDLRGRRAPARRRHHDPHGGADGPPGAQGLGSRVRAGARADRHRGGVRRPARRPPRAPRPISARGNRSSGMAARRSPTISARISAARRRQPSPAEPDGSASGRVIASRQVKRARAIGRECTDAGAFATRLPRRARHQGRY